MKTYAQLQRSIVTKAAFCLVILVLGYAVLLPLAQAQVASPNETTSEPTVSAKPLPFQSPNPDQEELKNLREKYKTQLSIYRTDERAYQIARENYNKLGTLTSLEAAVKATQKVMSSRIVVLETYLQMIKIALANTPGIDVQQKAATLKEIDQTLDRMKQHQEVLKNAVDRLQLSMAVIDYASINGEINTTVYKSLSYIAYGRVQTVYDKTMAIREEVKANLEEREKNGLILGEKRRAMDEIDRKLVGTTEKMNSAKDQFQPDKFGRAKGFDQGSYSKYVASLGQIYGELLRTVEYFREVIKT